MISRLHEDLLVRLHPRGAVDVDNATDARAELAAWGEVLDLIDGQVDELAGEMLPNGADALLAQFEALYAVYRVAGRTDDHRRRVLTARARRLPNCRPATLEALLEDLIDLPVTILEPGPFRCDHPGSLCDTPVDVLDGAFVWIITLDEADARSAGVDRVELEDELEIIKPAHTVAFTRCDDFICDDPWSLTDTDLLGV